MEDVHGEEQRIAPRDDDRVRCAPSRGSLAWMLSPVFAWLLGSRAGQETKDGCSVLVLRLTGRTIYHVGMFTLSSIITEFGKLQDAISKVNAMGSAPDVLQSAALAGWVQLARVFLSMAAFGSGIRACQPDIIPARVGFSASVPMQSMGNQVLALAIFLCVFAACCLLSAAFLVALDGSDDDDGSSLAESMFVMANRLAVANGNSITSGK